MSLEKERKYLFWMSRHKRTLNKYAGQWVGIKLGRGVVASGKSLKKVRTDFLKRYPNETPHLLQVPQKGQHFYVLISS